ncbi:probable polypeptide N-acetylgalactosaminyltransferase 8 isoform X1 [Antechinus flavipes]|uniref:probable polypeptide N-acetylgalactosaminyltransferase 8 isoform X1 n=1 Tax=Antechinus flavipes TaxID=38775 RepID=UPI0022368BC2|nr:probable polypeptide N-acetylgalactosaminyltransferase 8 isoform X1 [Antechinus flavipes]
MALRGRFPRVFFIRVVLIFVLHIALLFFIKRISHILKMGISEPFKNPLLASSWAITKKEDFEVLDDSMKEVIRLIKMKQAQVPKNLKDEEKNGPRTWKFKDGNKAKDKFQRKVFPNSALFNHWGNDLTENQQIEAQSLFLEFGYNVYLSNQLPLNRSIPDTRSSRCLKKEYPAQLPTVSVILTIMNDAISTIQRAITSIIYRTPPHLLKQLILVDDFSPNEELKEYLEKQIEIYDLKYPRLLTLIRHNKREGIATAWFSGWQAATADVVILLDAHIEVNIGWAEPILSRIQEDQTVVLSPMLDKIHFDTLNVEENALAALGFDWALWNHYDPLPKDWYNLKDDSAPVKSPSIMGHFAADRLFLGEIGSLDMGMKAYEGESVELGVRVWQCGGKIEVLPCSRVAHLEQAHKPYVPNVRLAMKRNALRIAEIWMDEYKPMVYYSWNLPMKNHGIDYGDVSSRKKLRKKLKCKSFDWYLRNVYPDLKPFQNISAYGTMKNSLNEKFCLDHGPIIADAPIMSMCNGNHTQTVLYFLSGELHVGMLNPNFRLGDHCLIDSNQSQELAFKPCFQAAANGWHMYWDFKQGRAITNRTTRRCLEIKENDSGSYALILQKCTGQGWKIQHIVKTLESV